MTKALVVIHQGVTAAHCPRPGCNNVEIAERGASGFYCSNCHHVGTLVWPGNFDEIFAELERRPVPQTRNWYPAGHPFAARHGFPCGQSVPELADEFAAHGGER